MTQDQIGKIRWIEGFDWITALRSPSIARLRSEDRIGLRVGKILNRYHVGKHCVMILADDSS